MKIQRQKVITLSQNDLIQAIVEHIRYLHSDKLGHQINTNDCDISFTNIENEIQLILTLKEEVEDEQ